MLHVHCKKDERCMTSSFLIGIWPKVLTILLSNIQSFRKRTPVNSCLCLSSSRNSSGDPSHKMELFTASQYVSPRGLLTPSQLFSTCYRTNKTTPWPLWGLAREYAGNSKKRIVNAVKFESTSVSKILISAKNWSLQKRNILSQPQVIARAMRERSSRNHSENHFKSSKFTKSWLSWKPKGSVKSCLMAILAEFVMLHTFFANPSAYAADALKTCACLLKECRVEFARCITDPACAANIACLQSCNNRPDETECQIKCGDLFENNVVDKFNECAVSRKNCVPRKLDEGKYPIPEPSVLVKSFNIADFSGKWYISSGLNPSFDTFDCQVHEFYPSESRLTGNLTWRISTPDGGFLTRSTVQRFVQDTSHPGILYNHDNEYLHYQDDWYILSSKIENKPDDYIFVYYRGKNDAWDGYGGSVVYTRSPTLPSSIVPELEKAARKVGLDFQKFRKTDNTCGPEPPLFARIEKKVIEGEQAIAKEVEEIEEKVEEVGKTEMTLLERLGKGFQEIKKDEENFLNVLTQEEKELLSDLKMEAEEVEKLFGKSIPIRKLR